MSSPPTTTVIEISLEGHVATITLDRPDQLNAFNEVMSGEVVAAWQWIRDEDEVHAVALRAKGERAFCTGIDIKEGVWWEGQNIWNQVDPGALLGPKHHKVWKPVVAAVHGMCAGGGQYLINEADIIICSEDATFFDPHATGGVVSAVEPVGMLHRGVPLGDVLRWALMGNDERITAATALRLGLVTEVVTRAELWPRAAQIASEIAERRPEAIQGTIRAIWEAMEKPRSVAIDNGMAYTHIGNLPKSERPPRPPKREPRFR